jgi:hypothetical protein
MKRIMLLAIATPIVVATSLAVWRRGRRAIAMFFARAQYHALCQRTPFSVHDDGGPKLTPMDLHYRRLPRSFWRDV